MRKKNLLNIFLITAAFFVSVGFYFSGTTHTLALNNHPTYGASFTKSLSESLGYDWREVYTAILDDLKIKKIRIGLNWDDIEAVPGIFNFSDYDWMVNEAEKRNAHITLAIGRRLIRWPECRIPQWAGNLSQEEIREKTMRMLSAAVNYFKNKSGVTVWQVENEPFFKYFGVGCPKGDLEFMNREIAFVRQLDPTRPIMITESGELSFWWKAAMLDADILGTSMYRYIWNKNFGFLKYPLPAWVYNMKGRFINWRIPRVIISELQTEPWAPNGFLNLTPEEEARTMSHDIFDESLEFARRTGYDEIYLWGVEWWYFKKQIGDPFYWETVGQLTRYRLR